MGRSNPHQRSNIERSHCGRARCQDPSFTQKVFGDVNPVLGAFTAFSLPWWS